jgi:hypothetical protein
LVIKADAAFDFLIAGFDSLDLRCEVLPAQARLYTGCCVEPKGGAA